MKLNYRNTYHIVSIAHVQRSQRYKSHPIVHQLVPTHRCLLDVNHGCCSIEWALCSTYENVVWKSTCTDIYNLIAFDGVVQMFAPVVCFIYVVDGNVFIVRDLCALISKRTQRQKRRGIGSQDVHSGSYRMLNVKIFIPWKLVRICRLEYSISTDSAHFRQSLRWISNHFSAPTWCKTTYVCICSLIINVVLVFFYEHAHVETHIIYTLLPCYKLRFSRRPFEKCHPT